jgi:hypothetical protein
MLVLKQNINELELSLKLEKEFNNHEHRINTDYLLNVLKSFLLSDNRSERARLAVAVTQILHMNIEESKAIADKWSEKKQPQPMQQSQSQSQGLVGWFMSPAKPVKPVTIIKQQQHK